MLHPSGATESTTNSHGAALGLTFPRGGVGDAPAAGVLSMQLTCMFANASPHPSRAASWNAFQPPYVRVQSYREHSASLAIHASTSSHRSGPRTVTPSRASNERGGSPHSSFSSTSTSCASSSRSANVRERLVEVRFASSRASDGDASVSGTSTSSANSPVRGSSSAIPGISGTSSSSGGGGTSSGSVMGSSPSPSPSVGVAERRGAGAEPPPGRDDMASPSPLRGAL